MVLLEMNVKIIISVIIMPKTDAECISTTKHKTSMREQILAYQKINVENQSKDLTTLLIFAMEMLMFLAMKEWSAKTLIMMELLVHIFHQMELKMAPKECA